MFADKEALEKKIGRYAEKVEKLTIFVQKEHIGFPWDYKRILALTDPSKEGRKAIMVAQALSCLHDAELVLGIIRPDQEVKSFLKAFEEIKFLAEFGNSESHKKTEDGELLPWTEGIIEDKDVETIIKIYPDRSVEEVTSFIERENIDLVLLPVHFGPKEEEVEGEGESTDGLSLFTRIIVYESPASVFLVRTRVTPPIHIEEEEDYQEEKENKE